MEASARQTDRFLPAAPELRSCGDGRRFLARTVRSGLPLESSRGS